METTERTSITVQTSINADIDKVWNYWNEPAHITKWCQASDDWHAPYAENDLRKGGAFKTTMAAKDGSMQFDFGGVYDDVTDHSRIAYTMSDGRHVDITFTPKAGSVDVVETFDAENTHPAEMQRAGWQAILDNFKKYTETN
jgi:uncharacterized protein YndB with AHSA1/START domain